MNSNTPLDPIEQDAREVHSSIAYLTEDTGLNRRFVWPGHELNTATNKPYDVTVRDGRGLEDHFTLDVQGFKLAKHETAVQDFSDNEVIASVYAKEIAELVKRETGADFVATTNWMVRTSGDIADNSAVNNYAHNGGVQPVAGEAHVDTNKKSSAMMAEKAYQKFFPGQPAYKRCIVMSNWRTFSPPPQDWPLAMCDYRSVAEDEGYPNTLVVVDKEPTKEEQRAVIADEDIRPTAYIFTHNPNHRWWYFSKMQPDEVLMFKFYDSDQSVAWRVPHTAFYDPSFGSDAVTRRSIEFRTVAYFL